MPDNCHFEIVTQIIMMLYVSLDYAIFSVLSDQSVYYAILSSRNVLRCNNYVDIL